MRHLLIIPPILFAIVLSARATLVELPVTPKQLEQQNYRFSVTAVATNHDIAFHIVITAKNDGIAPGSEAKLVTIGHSKDRHGTILGTSFTPFLPVAPLTLNQTKHTWTADFVVTPQSLKTPGTCFIFSESAHATVNSKVVAMPSVTFYEIPLKDFLKE